MALSDVLKVKAFFIHFLIISRNLCVTRKRELVKEFNEFKSGIVLLTGLKR